MVTEAAKELPSAFCLFESLSNPGKGRMRAIKRMHSFLDQVSEM
jgi:hypothetical protein